MLPLANAKAPTVAAALTAVFSQPPAPMRRTLTWDRGTEMTRHRDFSAATGVPAFFCDAYAPWQRGSNENTNGLLRQYFPKKTDLSLLTSDALAEAVDELNRRPRRTLHWQTPNEVYSAAIVAMRLSPPPLTAASAAY